jgi:hypothetical protein
MMLPVVTPCADARLTGSTSTHTARRANVRHRNHAVVVDKSLIDSLLK